MSTRLIPLAALALLLPACGGGSSGPQGPEGVFEITSHTLNEASCDVEGAQVTEPVAYFSLTNEDFAGYPILAWRNCTGPDPATCDEDLDLFRSFVHLNGAWRADATAASWSASCYLSVTEATLTEAEDGTLAIRAAERAGTLADIQDEDTCFADSTADRADELPCSLEVWQAAPVSAAP
jgi:hypothetical protein